MQRLFDGKWGVILTGIVVGILAPVLVKLGNPGNMGICVACFTRDVAGALGLHRAAAVQYIRPELIGMVFGAMIAAIAFKEFKPRAGAGGALRFLWGMLAAIGALMFLGCPWRAFLRVGGGDWNALVGIVGFVAGVAGGSFFLKQGYSLGRSRPASAALGWVMPAFMAGLLALLLLKPVYAQGGPVLFSTTGPGSQHAPIFIALGAGLLVGFLVQRARFCTVGAFRNIIMLKDYTLFYGIVGLVAAAAATNLALGLFKPGFAGQPIAHTDGLWNFLGMALSGLAFTLGGGCPGRQLILTGEGDGDATIFIMGLLVGAAFAHNFSLASSAAGPSAFGTYAVVIGLVIAVVLGFVVREAKEA
ncbi:MAG TPA: YedE family putative selenium transporter [Symbiobacteriaceae bacterium]|nr:YedE family putative selenium transporter [Symbiobacteriaceae bacterium]